MLRGVCLLQYLDRSASTESQRDLAMAYGLVSETQSQNLSE